MEFHDEILIHIQLELDEVKLIKKVLEDMEKDMERRK